MADAQGIAEEPGANKHLSVWVNGQQSLLSSSSEFLAKGSGGVVYSDLCDECNSKVAVKIIRTTPSNERNVHSEVDISLMLNHPNCIKTYRVFDYKDSVYMVQELATGGDLCDYLAKHGPIADERILKGIFGQMVAAVQYLHTVAKVSHNDIKPDNIVECVGGDSDIPRVCLIDFGHSQHIDLARRRPGIFGTTEYMPPEVFNNTSKFYLHDGEVADIWALGMTLFAMLTGTLPWAKPGPSCREFQYFLMRYKKNEQGAVFIHNPVHMLGFTTHLVELLDGMVNPDPRKRFTIAQVLPYLSRQWIVSPTRRRSSQLISELGQPLAPTKPVDTKHPTGSHIATMSELSDELTHRITNMMERRSLKTCVHGAAGESTATGTQLSGKVDPALVAVLLEEERERLASLVMNDMLPAQPALHGTGVIPDTIEEGEEPQLPPTAAQ